MADDFGSNFDLGGYEDLAPGGTDYYDFGQGDVPYQSTNIYGSPDTSSFFGNIGSALKNLFGGTGPGGDAAKFGAFLGLAGLANRSNFFNAPPTKVGYQGGIPQYTATRTQLPLPYSSTDQARLNQAVQNSLAQGFSLADTKLGAERRFGISPAEIDAALAANPPPYRRPGAGGITYFSPMQYSQAGEPASVAPTTPTTPVTPEPTTPSLTPSTEPQGAKKGILSARTGTTTGGAAAEEAASAPVAPEALSKLTPSQRLLFNQLSGKPGQGSDQTLLNYVSGLSDYQSLASLAASRGETGDLKNWGSERGYELAEELANKYGVSGTMTMGSGVTVPIKGTTTGAGTTPGGTTGTTTGGTTGGIGGLPGALKVDSAMKAYLEAQKQGDRHALSILARSGLSDAEITKALNAATGRNLTEEQVRTSLDIYQPGGVYEKAKLGMPNVVMPSTPAPKVESSLEASLRLNREYEAAREKFKRETGYYEDDPYYQAMQSFISKYGVSPQQASQMTPEQRLRLVRNTVGDMNVFSSDFGIFGVPKQGTVPVSSAGLAGNEKLFDQLLNERFGPSKTGLPSLERPVIEEKASGGIAGITTLSKGRYLRGNGDGVSDSIPARFAQSGQPAALADGEFVIPARVVSELGNGSSDAGARKLYAMLDRVEQRARKAKRGKPSGADRELNKLA